MFTNYEGNRVETVDAKGARVWRYLDPAGGITSVSEDPYGLGYQTDYGYHSLDRVKTVTQGSLAVRQFTWDGLGRLSQAVQPESGTTTYVYDGNGNLTSKTDARGVTVSLTYDAIDRLDYKSYNDGTPAVDYVWDSANPGRLLSVSANGVSTTSYSQHDVLDRPRQSTQSTAGQSYLFQGYTFNRNGDLTSVTYPSGRVITYTPDAAGRLLKVSGAKNGLTIDYASGMQYASHGAVSQIALARGLVENLRFNSRLQMDQVRLGTAAREQRIYPLNIAQSYSYDSLNRLWTASEAGWWSQTYSYDRWGNRAVTGYTPAGSLTPSAGADLCKQSLE